eukprot:TRINITY_DN90175_c0_g1_i1.p1 TRINITY_DN90175_c0_g1~~TRINITY_DN90175_c0_g1_i1.p1  ORF type:complete len:1279 (+),score=327.97 TRINITY_DN90175_c0_g1_i1:77-3913(+)
MGAQAGSEAAAAGVATGENQGVRGTASSSTSQPRTAEDAGLSYYDYHHDGSYYDGYDTKASNPDPPAEVENTAHFEKITHVEVLSSPQEDRSGGYQPAPLAEGNGYPAQETPSLPEVPFREPKPLQKPEPLPVTLQAPLQEPSPSAVDDEVDSSGIDRLRQWRTSTTPPRRNLRAAPGLADRFVPVPKSPSQAEEKDGASSPSTADASAEALDEDARLHAEEEARLRCEDGLRREMEEVKRDARMMASERVQQKAAEEARLELEDEFHDDADAFYMEEKRRQAEERAKKRVVARWDSAAATAQRASRLSASAGGGQLASLKKAGGECQTICNPKMQQKIRQMKYSRRLQQAMQEGSRSAVLQNALTQAQMVGCEDSKQHRKTIMKGAEIVPLVLQLEAGISSGDPERLRDAIALAEAGGAGAHTTPAKKELRAIERRKAAEKALEEALAEQRIAALEAAIEAAKLAGVKESRLEECRKTLERWTQAAQVRKDAEDELKAICEGESEPDAVAFANAVSRARLVGLSEGVIAAYEARARVRMGIKSREAILEMLNAVEDPLELSTVIPAARQGALEPHILEEYVQRLRAAQAILADLENAIADKSIPALRKSIAAAKQLKTSPETVAEAEAILRLEERLQELREQLEAAARDLADDSVPDAVADVGIRRLLDLVEVARSAGLPAAEVVAHEEIARESRHRLTKRQLKAAADPLRELSMVKAPQEEADDAVRRLMHIIEVARGNEWASEETLRPCEDLILAFVRKRKAWAMLQSATADAEAFEVGSASFEDLVSMKRRMFLAVEEAVAGGLGDPEILVGAERLRRRLHNAVEDRKGVVRLFCRVRPLVSDEVANGERAALRRRDAFSLEVTERPRAVEEAATSSMRLGAASMKLGQDGGASSRGPATWRRPGPEDGTSSTSLKPALPVQATLTPRGGGRDDHPVFAFDACWTPGSQQDVFEDAMDLVQSAVDGYNVTIFAYGQTGAGKTYTMYGGKNPDERGLCPRAAEELFAIIERQGSQGRCEFSVTTSLVELYCKRFIDLLDIKSNRNLKIRNTPQGEVYLENLHEQPVTSPEEIKRLIDLGLRERHTREHQLNAASSRSHLMLILKVCSKDKQTGKTLHGKMLLVDLSGSERVRRSGVTGAGLKEACEINSSLSALGDVIQALVRGDNHVPYRNHELTQVMQDSLGGTAKTLMFVNLSPATCNLTESLMSLKYAQRAKGVVNDPTASVSGASPDSSPADGSVLSARATPRSHVTPRSHAMASGDRSTTMMPSLKESS